MNMKDNQLVCMAGLIIAAYAIYMGLGPGGDGVIFGSVIAAVCTLAGMKLENYRLQRQIIEPSKDGGNIDE